MSETDKGLSMIEIDGVKYTEEDLTQEGVVRAGRISALKKKQIELMLELQEVENNIVLHARLIKEQQESLNHNPAPAEASDAEADG